MELRDLKVGDFVRTKYGYIVKIININEFREPSFKYGVEASYLKDIMFIGDDDIIKASDKLIDLVCEGDYINGMRVFKDDEYDFLYVQCINGDDNLYCESITKQSFINNIKSIVTKEQFEQMSYKVGE